MSGKSRTFGPQCLAARHVSDAHDMGRRIWIDPPEKLDPASAQLRAFDHRRVLRHNGGKLSFEVLDNTQVFLWIHRSPAPSGTDKVSQFLSYNRDCSLFASFKNKVALPGRHRSSWFLMASSPLLPIRAQCCTE